MAIKKFLMGPNKEGKQTQIWPITREDCIYMEDGSTLLSNALKDMKTSLEGQIAAEESRAKAAEEANATAIANEVTRAQGKEGELAQAIADEVQNRIDAVQGVQDQLDALAGDGEGSVADQIADLKSDLEGQMADAAEAQAEKDSAQDKALTDAIGVAPAEGVEGSGLRKEIADAVKAEQERAEGVESGHNERLEALETFKNTTQPAKDLEQDNRIQALEDANAEGGAVANAIKQVADDLADFEEAQAAKDGEQDQALADEAARAKGEEQRIEGLVTAEAERADAEEKRIVGLVEAEATRAAAAEKANADEMTKQKDAAQEGTLANKIAANAAAVAAEETRAKGVEAELDQAIKDEATARDNAVKAEAQAREQADNALDGRLDVVEAAIGENGALESRVAANEAAIEVINGTGEGSIKKAVADLVDGAPEALDTLNELAAALRDDADVLTAVETAFDNKLATLQADVDQNEADCDAAIAAEKQRAEGQEAAIRQELANEKAALQAEIDADVKVVADELAKQKDAAQEGTLANQIKDENERAVAKENEIAEDLADENERAVAAEEALGARIDAIFAAYDGDQEYDDLSPIA